MHLEAVHQWVVVDDIKRENSPRSFGSGHVSGVLELLNLIVSTGFFNYFHSHPVTAFANILGLVLDPTNTRTHAALHSCGRENCASTSGCTQQPRVVNFLLRVPSHGSRYCLTTFIWTPSPIRYIVLAFRMLCLGSKRLGKLRTPGLPCTLRQDCAIRMGCRPYAEAPIRVAHRHPRVAAPQRLHCLLLLDFEAHSLTLGPV